MNGISCLAHFLPMDEIACVEPTCAREIDLSSIPTWTLRKGKDQEMWSRLVETLHAPTALMLDSIKACPTWPILKSPLFVCVFVLMLIALSLRRAYKAVVLLVSSLVAVVVCQTTLIDVAVPDCFANKLPVFVVGFIIIAAINVYYLLIRDRTPRRLFRQLPDSRFAAKADGILPTD